MVDLLGDLSSRLSYRDGAYLYTNILQTLLGAPINSVLLHLMLVSVYLFTVENENIKKSVHVRDINVA